MAYIKMDKSKKNIWKITLRPYKNIYFPSGSSSANVSRTYDDVDLSIDVANKKVTIERIYTREASRSYRNGGSYAYHYDGSVSGTYGPGRTSSTIFASEPVVTPMKFVHGKKMNISCTIEYYYKESSSDYYDTLGDIFNMNIDINLENGNIINVTNTPQTTKNFSIYVKPGKYGRPLLSKTEYKDFTVTISNL